MFSLGFYLNYDPSHLTWLGIDPVVALRGSHERVVHAQAKDVEIDQDGLNEVGVFGKAINRANPWDNRGYRYRVPGLGQVDWRAIVDTLYQVGFDGVLSVEHEDPVWSGDTEKVLSGLAISYETLRPLIRRPALDAAPLESK